MMRVVANAVPRAHRRSPRSGWRSARLLQGLVGTCLALAIVPNIHGTAGSPLGANHVTPAPRSWIGNATLLTVYGRGFGTAPVLGRLGMDRSMDDVARQLAPVGRAITAGSGQPVRLALHLIYALATPCSSANTCLLYLDDSGVDLVKQYIEPAARRGWLVILDDQLGRSTPETEMSRLIGRGYLAYDNVEVAFDPEFRTVAGQQMPGIPTGYVTADELNDAQDEMNEYSRQQGLAHRKLLLVHQWRREMIRGWDRIRTDLPYVQPVLVMDGIGSPSDKASMYQTLLGSAALQNVVPAVKLFPPNPYDPGGHVDDPMLSWQQILGQVPADDVEGVQHYIHPAPRVIVLT